MAEARYPYGYQQNSDGVMGMGTMLTLDEMRRQTTVKNLHREVWRRYSALMKHAHSKLVPLGVGTGWRIQPNPPPDGFAQPGNSWHESCPVNPTSATALAIDTVPEPSWPWMENHVAEYGLRTFKDVNDEPWHVQPVEAPAGRNWATTLPPLNRWELPEEEDMPLTDADVRKIWAAMPVDKIAREVWDHMIDTSTAPGAEPEPARLLLDRTILILRQYVGSFNNQAAPRVTMLERIDANVRKLLNK